MSGYLSSLSADQQIEALYIAYFGRAADMGGEIYWLTNFTALTNPVSQGGQGLTNTQAIVNIADNFAVQPEAKALYSFLATPPAIPIPNPSSPPAAVQLSVNTFLTGVYQDLFNRAPDANGEAYWSTQILSGAVSVGAAIFDIANGAAVGSIDAGVLGYKLQAATSFTSTSGAANQGTTPPLSASFLAEAHASVVNVVDAASEAASQAADLVTFGASPTVTVPATGSTLPAGSTTSGASDTTVPVASLASLSTTSPHTGA